MREHGQRPRSGRVEANDAVAEKSDSSSFRSAKVARSIVQHSIRLVAVLLRRQLSSVVPGWSNRLTLWLQRMEMGNKVDDRTPFYRDRSWFWVRKVLPAIYHIRSGRGVPEWAIPGFEKVEREQLENIGPKSLFLPYDEDGPEKIKAVMCDKPKMSGFNESAWRLALSDVEHALPARSVSSIGVQEALKGMGGKAKYALDPDTNSGFPGWVKDWANANRMNASVITEVPRLMSFRNVQSKVNAIVRASQTGSPGELIPLDWVGTLSQRLVQKGLNPLTKKKGQKTYKGKRMVIAMPKEEVWAGKTLMAPLQPALLNGFVNLADGSSVIAGWLPQPELDKTVQSMLEHAEKHKRTVLSGDISSFDATLPPWAMWDIANAISSWFSPSGRKLFLSILYADIYHTRVITPTEVLGPGPSSVKSGSIFTSLLGCMANYAIQKYGEHCGLYQIELTHVMGDDFIVDGPGVSPRTMEEAFAAFGMECNASKQYFERGSCHFLQRLHILGCPGGIGSIARVGGGALAVEDDTQLKYDERNPFAYIFQALARLENAAFNPQFAELVEWLSQGDERYHLGKDYPTSYITKRAGSYAERKMKEAVNRPWTSTGSGVPFDNWSVNRVLRGVEVPPLGKERFEFVYGVKYDDVRVRR